MLSDLISGLVFSPAEVLQRSILSSIPPFEANEPIVGVFVGILIGMGVSFGIFAFLNSEYANGPIENIPSSARLFLDFVFYSTIFLFIIIGLVETAKFVATTAPSPIAEFVDNGYIWIGLILGALFAASKPSS